MESLLAELSLLAAVLEPATRGHGGVERHPASAPTRPTGPHRPHDAVHLKQRRIEKASILLHHTDHSIDEIAELCGFGDRYYFTRVFTRQLGLGPAAYRKRRAL